MCGFLSASVATNPRIQVGNLTAARGRAGSSVRTGERQDARAGGGATGPNGEGFGPDRRLKGFGAGSALEGFPRRGGCVSIISRSMNLTPDPSPEGEG